MGAQFFPTYCNNVVPVSVSCMSSGRPALVQSHLKVVTPERSDLILTTNIPDSETDILVFNGLHVEPCKHKAEILCLEDRNRSSPIVGIVVTISPSFNLYKIVVFPAASRPTGNIAKSDLMRTCLPLPVNLPISIRICFFPKSLPKRLEMVRPMLSLSIREVNLKYCSSTVRPLV